MSMWIDGVLYGLDLGRVLGHSDNNGWRMTRCPYCGDHGQHLGINIESGAVNCWRCGTHPFVKTLVLLSNKSKADVLTVLKKYDHIKDLNFLKPKEPSKPLSFKYNKPLNRNDQRFLMDRDFDPDKLVEEWDLRGSDTLSDFKYRIIIPVYYRNKIAAFQGRDITNASRIKYRSSSPTKDGGENIKNLLYGMDKATKDRVIVVEGPADVWRLGAGAVCTFGIQYTLAQVYELKRFTNRFIMFDNEDLAQEAAKDLADDLSMFAGRTEIIKISGYKDAGDIPDKEAHKLMKELGFVR